MSSFLRAICFQDAVVSSLTAMCAAVLVHEQADMELPADKDDS